MRLNDGNYILKVTTPSFITTLIAVSVTKLTIDSFIMSIITNSNMSITQRSYLRNDEHRKLQLRGIIDQTGSHRTFDGLSVTFLSYESARTQRNKIPTSPCANYRVWKAHKDQPESYYDSDTEDCESDKGIKEEQKEIKDTGPESTIHHKNSGYTSRQKSKVNLNNVWSQPFYKSKEITS